MQNNLVRDACRCLRNWLQTDRVRASPGVGRFLNLEPKERLLYKHEIFVIEHREILASPEQVISTYLLTSENNHSDEVVSMIVTLATASPTAGSIIFISGSQAVEVFYGEVIILANRGSDVSHFNSRQVECLDR